MKRFPYVIAATAAGLAAVLTYHTGRPAAAPTTGGGNGSPEPSGTSHHSTSTTKPSTANKSAGTNPRTTTTTKPPATTAPNRGVTTATGAREDYGYGVLATRVTVKGSSIVDVRVVGLQVAESYSQQLANYAIPQLRHEVLASQSSNISGVTGATYTSQAYQASVQSALDQLHV